MKKSTCRLLALSLLAVTNTAFANPGRGPDHCPGMDHERAMLDHQGPFMNHPDEAGVKGHFPPPPFMAPGQMARGGHGGPLMGPKAPMHDGIMHLLKFVDLTTEQKIAIDKELSKMLGNGAEAKARIEEAGRELGKLLMTLPLDKAAIIAQQDKIAGYQKILMTNKLDHDIAVYNILTAEQQAKIKEMLEHRPDGDPAKHEQKGPECQCGAISAEQVMPPPPDAKGRRGRK